MSAHGDMGQAPLGGDDLGDLKVKRGGGPVIAVLFIIIALGAAGAAVWYFMLREDPGLAHEQFRTEVFGVVHNQYYDPFWTCALGGVPLSNFKNNAELVARIQVPAKQGPAAAAANAERLKTSENCLPLLSKAIPEYRAIKTNPETPAEYHPMIDEIATSLESIEGAWNSYAAFHTGAAGRNEYRERVLKRGGDWIRYVSATEERIVKNLTPVQGTNAVAYAHFIQCALGETSYTSFTTEGEEIETSAQYKVADHLELGCDNGGEAFVAKLNACKSHLFAVEGNEIDDAFEEVVAHWIKQGVDTQSGAPITQCLERAEKAQAQAVAENVAKAWYDFTKAYNKLYEHSKSQSGSYFDRGRSGG